MKLNPKNAVITGLAAFLLAAGVSSCSHAEPRTYSLDVVLWRDMGGVASFVDADGRLIDWVEEGFLKDLPIADDIICTYCTGREEDDIEFFG